MINSLCSVAIVDDHNLVRRIVRMFLSLNGFFVSVEAENGRDLLSQLNALQKLPDICLLDLRMPIMNGYETILHLRAEYPTIRILVFTLFANPDEKENIKSLDADGFLAKESEMSNWMDVLTKVCYKGR